MSELEFFFSAQGGLAQIIPGYKARQSQIDMALSVAQAIAAKQNLIAEAGTGTGKTFAYLAPAILSGKKVIVSTGTKNLQDQLFNKDLPLIRKAMSRSFKAALLKGRANYLCLYRLENALHSSIGYQKADAQALNKIKVWAKSTLTGDISEISDVTEGDPIWSQATSNADNCVGQECSEYADCFLVKARKKAQDSDVVVVNHHLLCADWSLKETGFGELLPTAQVVIIDEAHQLPEIASNFLGMHLTTRQMNDLATDTIQEYLKDAKDMPDLRTACENLQHELKDLRLAFGVEIRRGEWSEIERNPKLIGALETLREQLYRLSEQLERASDRSKALESCLDRAEEQLTLLDDLLTGKEGRWIRWYETHSKTLTLSKTPLNIASEFRQFMLQHPASWIFTSATLSVAQDFSHFANAIGIEDTPSKTWESPFNYPEQSLFYHPKGLPQPNDPNFSSQILDFVIPVLKASRGRAFFLFTSYKALNTAADILADTLPYPILVQGTRSKSMLLQQFKQTDHAVLLATASFWEGVDVRGEALSCVIIDKLPFASPGDPVLKARLQAMEQKGLNPFFHYQLPNAVIALRQGVGRLIRDSEDRGVLMVCDPRLLKRAYGQFFLDSVPNMKRTRDIQDVYDFFADDSGHSDVNAPSV